jgi:hypothetical protein
LKEILFIEHRPVRHQQDVVDGVLRLEILDHLHQCATFICVSRKKSVGNGQTFGGGHQGQNNLNFFELAVFAEPKFPQFIGCDALKVQRRNIEKQHVHVLLEKRQCRLRDMLFDVRFSIRYVVHDAVDFFKRYFDAVVFFQ